MVLRAALLSVLLLGLSVSLAHAHPGHEAHGGHGLVEGLIHPWTGLDHLLAMLAVGLLAVGLSGRMLWGLPLVFLGSMLSGAAAANAGLLLPGVETGIALSVVVLGAALAAGRIYPNLVVTLVICLCGLLHGHAHAAEMPGSAIAADYLAGMLLGSALLLGGGVAVGFATRAWPVAARVSGGAVSAAGLVLLLALR